MSTVHNTHDMQEVIRDAVHEHWKFLLFQGAVMVVLGVLALVVGCRLTGCQVLERLPKAFKVFRFSPFDVAKLLLPIITGRRAGLVDN